MGTESPKCNAFALGFSLPLASFFRVTETKTLFALRFGPPLAMALVSVEKDKKGVTLAVTASLLSLHLLPPFSIDTGSFGADLMTSWSNYTKSTVIFNKSHL